MGGLKVTAQALVQKWFACWRDGTFREIPVTDDFTHVSPYGTVRGKDKYLQLVEDNQELFLGHTLDILDELYAEDRACVRYESDKSGFQVSEWYYIRDGLIARIVAYYDTDDGTVKARGPFKIED